MGDLSDFYRMKRARMHRRGLSPEDGEKVPSIESHINASYNEYRLKNAFPVSFEEWKKGKR